MAAEGGVVGLVAALARHNVACAARLAQALGHHHEQVVADLAARTGKLVVPQLFWGNRHIVGFDPDALAELVAAYRATAA